MHCSTRTWLTYVRPNPERLRFHPRGPVSWVTAVTYLRMPLCTTEPHGVARHHPRRAQLPPVAHTAMYLP